MIWILLILQLVTLGVVAQIRYGQLARKGKASAPAPPAEVRQERLARVLSVGDGAALLRARLEARIKQAEEAKRA